MEWVKNRYMFDTSALNKIIESTEDEILICESKKHGYEYVFTEIQVQESENCVQKRKSGIPEDLVERSRVQKAFHLLRIIIKFQTTYVGQIATLRKNRWLLDGTFELLPDDEEKAFDVFKEVLHNNDRQHYNDAMIAMTAIRHGCMLVARDGEFFKKFRRVFPDRYIYYGDFIDQLTGL